MTQMNFVHRGRQAGKTNEMAAHIAERSGLPITTCADLLRHGWTYLEFMDQQSRWEAPAPKLPPKPNVRGLLDDQWARVVRDGLARGYERLHQPSPDSEPRG